MSYRYTVRHMGFEIQFAARKGETNIRFSKIYFETKYF